MILLQLTCMRLYISGVFGVTMAPRGRLPDEAERVSFLLGSVQLTGGCCILLCQIGMFSLVHSGFTFLNGGLCFSITVSAPLVIVHVYLKSNDLGCPIFFICTSVMLDVMYQWGFFL